MTETGRVREILGNSVFVVPDKGAACFGCMNQECRSKSGLITAENPLGLPLKPGQSVELKAPGLPLFVQALAVFLPPLLGFAAGFSLVRLLFPAAGEGAAAALGAVFLFASAFFVYRVRKKLPAGTEYAVTRIF